MQFEILELRSLAGRLHAELLQAKLAAAGGRGPRGLDGEAEVRTLGVALDRASEALAHAAEALREADRKAAELAEAVRRQQDQLRRSEMLRREVDHRVANSLQALVSLMRIEAGQQRASDTELLRRSCSRIEALAVLHGMLHAQQRTGTVDVDTYVGIVCASLARALGGDGLGPTLIAELDPLEVEPEVAQALALVVNELVTNAFRHAFDPGAAGIVRVRGKRLAGGGYRLSVADDGKGLPNGFSLGGRTGFGHRLVGMMAEQVGAAVEASVRGGTRIALFLPRARPHGTLR
ncbi:sensor histidine kinase [Arenibaculum sp.]|jgi:two-component sensor histidine kinase|uniref:sensor histidine kinase n=1 Tax=Arenibaculum sp. TaxID=2865862 RepID=UPI002E13A24C|nr:sensor histidine kinase [Arenibaculum sp.]